MEAQMAKDDSGLGAGSLVDEEDIERLRVRVHDTVLQTLEFIASGGTLGQRADRQDLMRLAAREATELRHYLEGLIASENANLGQFIKDVVSHEECLSPAEIEVVFGGVDGTVDRMACVDLAGAVREALINARKHSQAARVVVYVEESDGGALITVEDDGVGADLARLEPRLGMRHSLRGRMARLGGTFEIDSAVGAGMTVTLRLFRQGERLR